MQAPVRFLYALRPGASPGVLGSAVVVASMFTATPFLIPGVAERLDVSLGAAGLISTFQVGAFALSSLVAGRFVPPGRAAVGAAGLTAAVVNVASALAPTLGVLLVLRAVAGAAAGVLTWVAWADAMQGHGALRSVATMGPLTTLLLSPVFGYLVSAGGDRPVFLGLALLCLPLLVLPVRLLGSGRVPVQRSRSRSNRILLAALFLLTMAGSSVFVYAAAAASELLGLSLAVAALGFSLNAGTSMIATHLVARPGTGGRWLMLTGVAAGSLLLLPHPAVFFAAMATWGFAFWMGIPATFRALADRSLSPEERIGDAQSGMALGRALGPLLGGLLVGGGAYQALGAVAATGMVTAALAISSVEAHRARQAERL